MNKTPVIDRGLVLRRWGIGNPVASGGCGVHASARFWRLKALLLRARRRCAGMVGSGAGRAAGAGRVNLETAQYRVVTMA